MLYFYDYFKSFWTELLKLSFFKKELLFKNEFRHTGTENTIKQGGLGSFKSNQTTDRRLEELVKSQDIVYSIDTVKKYLKEVEKKN